MRRFPGIDRVQRTTVFGIPLGLLACAVVGPALGLAARMEALLRPFPALEALYIATGAATPVGAFAALALLAVAFWMMAAVAAILRPRPFALRLLRAGCLVAYVLFVLWALLALRFTGLPSARHIEVAGTVPDALAVFRWRLLWLRWPAAGVLAAAVLHLQLWRAAAMRAFGLDLQAGYVPPGDRLLESLRTHGAQPDYRRSQWRSIGLHVFFILMLPWILSLFRGCIEPYRIPKGSGEPEISVVQVVRAERQKKRYVLNPNSAISFRIPELDDSKVLQEVEQMTQLAYTADASRVTTGRIGAGGGKQGGWPDGMENALVRFIRLEYGGPNWDDGMDAATRSDRNFLDYFRQLTGFKTATHSESHPISDLRRYPPGYAPPFVFMTGTGAINVSAGDIRILREYLLGGGMLFADCGSPTWHNNFRNFMAAVFPGEALRVIADDDPIFQFPFAFPNGAPPFWHHGGRRALGIRHQGRWVVFYHPGDLKDTWRTGHSGLAPHLARSGMDLGVNIIYYAFTHYLDLTRKLRK